MSKTLLSRIKKPQKSTSRNVPSETRIRWLGDKVIEILKTQEQNNKWEEALESQFQNEEEIPVSDVLDRIQNVELSLKFFNWVLRRQNGLPDPQSYSSLVKTLANCKRFHEINALLETMRGQRIQPTIDALNVLIKAYSDLGSSYKALQFYSIAREELNALPNALACNSLLSVLVGSGRTDVARQVFDEMLEGYGGEVPSLDNYSVSIMVRGLCKEGKIEEGRKMIEDKWGCIPNVVFYNTLIDGYCKEGDTLLAYKLFREMKLKGFVPTMLSYGALINGFCKEGNFELIDRLLADMKRRGLNLNIVIYNSVLDAKCKHGSIVHAMVVFNEMLEINCEPDIITYNTLISGSCRDGNIRQADDLLKEAMMKGLRPNKLSYTPLIHGYYKQGNPVKASNLMIEMMGKGHRPDLVTYGVLIHGLISVGEVDDALVIHDKMIERGVSPDASIYNFLMNGLSKKGRLPALKQLFADMLNRNVLPDEFVYATVIDAFIRHGDLGEAKRLFEFMEGKGIEPGAVSYNAMIKGYCKFGMMNDAISCVNKMIMDNHFPDQFTYTTIIDGYVKQNNINGALKAYGSMIKRHCEPNTVTYTVLINGFCRKGDFDIAQRLFKEMKSCGLTPNVVTYSILIRGFCRDGKLCKAAFLFEEMLLNNCIPNDVTFQHLINGFMDYLSLVSECHEHGKSMIVDMFMSMILDKCESRTSAYNAVIICLSKHRMVKTALYLRSKMLERGCSPDSVTFVSLLHGICLEGRSREWRSLLSCEFDQEKLKLACKYSMLLDHYLYGGLTSEASWILQNIGRGLISESGMDKQEAKTLGMSVT